MDEEEKKKIRSEIEVKRKELDELKVKLDAINQDKEAWFEKKRQATRQISDLAKNAKDVKVKRDSFTKQVRDSKNRRQELNKQLRDKINEMKALQKEKRDITKKFSIRGDPSKLKKEIEMLEMKIETEALPFKIEQQVMKKISENKKILNQFKSGSDVFDKIHNLQKEITALKTKADDTHKKVQDKADESQKLHETLIGQSKEVTDAKTAEEEALKQFVDYKEKWNAQNDLVKAKQSEINGLRAQLGEIVVEEKKKTKKVEEKKMVEQEKTVEEKIKNKMKLTTEDLLVFQAQNKK